MIVRLDPEDLGDVALVPQAIIQRSVEFFARECGLRFDRDKDDLDDFSCVYFDVNGEKAGLIHYDGEADDHVTVFLKPCVTRKCFDKTVNQLLKHYHLKADAVSWKEPSLSAD